MIISHKNKFIFFKPMKCAGSSVEVSLLDHCDKKDVITGTLYAEELSCVEFDYLPRNNFKTVGIHSIETIEASHDKINIITMEPIYHSHTSPQMLKRVSGKNFDSYFKFTIVRNPWDALVSYFWWTFYGFKIAGETSKNRDYSHFGKTSTIPMRSDSDTVLRIKFQNFLESKANESDLDGLGEWKRNDTLLSWFARFFESFYEEDIDLILRFENLKEDYSLLCKKLQVQEKNLHQLKTWVRKSKKPYQIYYNDYTRDLVEKAFYKTIKRFDYNF